MSDPKVIIRDSLADAEEISLPANDGGSSLPPPDPEFGSLPDNCPIRPLGVGPNMFYFIDALGHFQEVEVSKLSRMKILQMIGSSGWLWTFYPQYNKDQQQTGWKINKVSEHLSDGCNRRGNFDPAGRVRGAGMWQDKDGRIVTHCGDRLFVGRKEAKPGVHEDIVYPSRGTLPSPLFTDYRDTGKELFNLLRTWNWQRGDTDVKFVMGWIAAAMLGAAASWRPMIWISGDPGTGKSAIQFLLQDIFGGFLLQAADASRAGLFQTLHYDCLPVALDELEPDADPRKQQEIIGLARLAASGAVLLRGGQDGKAMGFQARSAFLFSSILTPPLKAADKSRMAICELGPVKATSPLGDLSKWREAGRRIMGRVILEWPRYTATFQAYRNELLAVGHSPRAADQFGALGAGYDLLTREGFDPAAPKAWAASLPAGQLRETADYVPDSVNCLTRLLTSAPQIFRGGKTETVAYWLHQADKVLTGELSDKEESDPIRVLSSLGVRVWIDDRYPNIPMPERPRYICVANSHEGTGKIFEGSHWQAIPGAPGVWVQALKRIKDARVGRMWIDGATHRCVMVPFEQAFPNNKGRETAAMDDELPDGSVEYEPGANG